MSTYKTTNGDYTVSVGPFNGNAWTGTMTVNGNLNVQGNITYVTDIAVNDAFIRVAANNTGTVQDMGLIATKTANTFAGLRFDTVANTWQISSSTDANGVAIEPYVAFGGGAGTVAGSNTQIQYNNSGVFGASSNLVFDFAANKLTIQGTQIFGNIASTPTYTGNGVALYNKVQGSGGTGLYVVNSTVDDELVSKSKAIVFGIIN
jgi:hypothetical protein